LLRAQHQLKRQLERSSTAMVETTPLLQLQKQQRFSALLTPRSHALNLTLCLQRSERESQLLMQQQAHHPPSLRRL